MRCATPKAAACAQVDAVGHARRRVAAPTTTSSANAPTIVVPDDPVADRDGAGSDVRALAHLDDRAGELAARHERGRHADLVLVGDQQHVGEVDRGGVDADADLARADRGGRQVVDHDDSGGP